MNIVRTGLRSVWKRSWTFLGVKLQRFGSEKVRGPPRFQAATAALGRLDVSLGARLRPASEKVTMREWIHTKCRR